MGNPPTPANGPERNHFARLKGQPYDQTRWYASITFGHKAWHEPADGAGGGLGASQNNREFADVCAVSGSAIAGQSARVPSRALANEITQPSASHTNKRSASRSYCVRLPMRCRRRLVVGMRGQYAVGRRRGCKGRSRRLTVRDPA